MCNIVLVCSAYVKWVGLVCMIPLTALSGWNMYDCGELSIMTTFRRSRPSLFRSWRRKSLMNLASCTHATVNPLFTSSCPKAVYLLYYPCTIHVLSMYYPCTIHVLYIPYTCYIHVLLCTLSVCVLWCKQSLHSLP